jgi:hypothetical protein
MVAHLEEPVEDKGNVVNDEEHDLFDADPNCEHETKLHPSGGIVCKKCSGWFCY